MSEPYRCPKHRIPDGACPICAEAAADNLRLAGYSGNAGMSEPRTAAGKAMLRDRMYRHAIGHVLAIEEQAATEARRELLAGRIDDIRVAISNAYYDARNAGETMEDAASRATGAVIAVLRG